MWEKKTWEKTCVLTVRDDELSVGDDEDTSEACEKKTCAKTMHEKHVRKNMCKTHARKTWEKTCVKKHVRKTCKKKHVRKNMREKTCGKKHGRKNIARKNMRKNMCARCQRRWAQRGRWRGHIGGMWEKNIRENNAWKTCEKKHAWKNMCEKHARKNMREKHEKNMREKTCEKKHVGKNKGEKTLREKTCEKKHVRKNMCARCQRRWAQRGRRRDASSGAAEGMDTRRVSGRPHGWSWTCHVVAASRPRVSGRAQEHCWGGECQGFLYLHLLLSYSCSTHKNKFNDI